MATTTTTFFDAQIYTRANKARLPAPLSKFTKFMHVPWTATALTTGQTVSICALPPGVIPRPALSFIIMTTDITTSTLTVDIGPAADPNGWAAAVDCAAIGLKACCIATTAPPAYAITATALVADTGLDYVEIYATFTLGASTLDLEGIVFVLAYDEQI